MAAAQTSEWIFVRRVLTVFALAALAYALWTLSDILLLIFGAALTAVALRAMMEPIVRTTGLSEPLALCAIFLALAVIIAGLVMSFGPKIAEQSAYLFQQLPVALNTLAQELDLQASLDQLKGSAIGALAVRAFSWGSSVFGAVASLVIVLVAGIYFANAPLTYRNGMIKLFPERWHKSLASTIDDAGQALRLWLRAQLMAMVLVGVMMGVGMWAIGVPSPLALGLIAGLTEFVPIIGPIVGAAPAVLLASTQGMDLVLWALGIAIVVQQVENNIIMPLLVGRVVELPAAVALFATVAFGVLFGPLGLIFGYPLAIVADVAVRRLYVRETLGERVDIPSERSRKAKAPSSAP
jgi:predicted PurR-regulated permease PerM